MSASTPHTGPRWPRHRWISSTALTAYRECPHRVRLKHVEAVTPPWRYNLHYNKGRTTHLILKRVADAHVRGQAAIDEDEMRAMALRHLPRQQFPSEEEWRRQAQEVVSGALAGMRYLERIPDARYLLVERNLSREWRVGAGRYTLMARPDVVVQRRDDDSAPLIEIIDYKTGKVRPQPEPPVLMRFVGRDLWARQAGNASEARVRFTYLWVNTADRTRIDLTLEHCHEQWEGITRTLHDLAVDDAWEPHPGRHCRFCPYFQNACRVTIPDSAG